MSWLFSRVLVEESLGENSLDGAQFALWSVTSTQQQSLPNGKTTASWKPSRYGQTYKPLTDDYGEAVLTSFLEGFPARILVSQERAQGSTAKEAECGDTWRELSVKFDRDSCSWKTHQCLFIEDLEESLVTFPRWGMIRDGELLERTMSAPRIIESESGYWPTPRAGNPGSRPNGKGGKILAEEVKKSLMWPTPTVHCSKEWDSPAERHWQGSGTLTHIARGGDQTLPRGLNPDWVEWLMGWPIGWTDLKPLAMDKFQQWQDLHGVS